MWFIWNKTTFGKNMFALGSNEEAARVSGVNVLMTTVLVFALAGAMYGWTGFVEGARVGSNTANTGLNYELDGIAACVIGGVSFVGGIGKIRGIGDRRAAAPPDLRGPEHGQRQSGPDLSGQGRHYPVCLRPGYAQISGQEIIASDF